MSKPEPLPCPFCHKLPEVGPKDIRTEGEGHGYVRCLNRRCPVKPWILDGELVCDDRGVEKYKRLAVNRWNRSIRKGILK